MVLTGEIKDLSQIEQLLNQAKHDIEAASLCHDGMKKDELESLFSCKDEMQEEEKDMI